MTQRWIILKTPDGDIRINTDRVERLIVNNKDQIVEFYFSPDNKLKIAAEGADADFCITAKEFKDLIIALSNI
ncbi:MAG TPA: hypothetical protein VF399_10950 [bacterium]